MDNMREAAYSYIDYCMLWISAFQLVLSIAGMIGIVYSILSYRHAVRNQTESEALTRDTINSLKQLIELQSKSHEFEKLNVRIQNKPLFVNHHNSNHDGSTVTVRLKNTGQTANNIKISKLNVDEWTLLNDSTMRRNILIGEEIIIRLENKQAVKLSNDEINKKRAIVVNTTISFELEYNDSVGNSCKQEISGNYYSFSATDVEYI